MIITHTELYAYARTRKLCHACRQHARDWLNAVPRLSRHPSCKPLDNGRFAAGDRLSNARQLARDQIEVIEQICQKNHQ